MYKLFIPFFIALMTLSACEPAETDDALEAALVNAPQVSMVDASAHPESIPKRRHRSAPLYKCRRPFR